jgi:hypothetical protein
MTTTVVHIREGYDVYIGCAVLLSIGLGWATIAYADWCERRYKARIHRLVENIREGTQ